MTDIIDIYHVDLLAGSIHVPYQWSYTNATARLAASGFVSTDVGKLARQVSDNTLWMLSATTPTWVQVGSPAASSSIWASPPGSPQAGALWLPSDSPYLGFYDGSVWKYKYREHWVVPPDDSAFSWGNQGDASVSSAGGITTITQGTSVVGQEFRVKTHTAPKTYEVGLRLWAIGLSNFQQMYIGLRDNSGGANQGRLIMHGYLYSGGGNIDTERWPNNTGFGDRQFISAEPFVSPQPDGLIWLRIVDDNTNTVFSYSLDHIHWIQTYTASRTAYMTPTQVMYGLHGQAQSGKGFDIISWKES